MKDEVGVIVIEEFLGLRGKMYSFHLAQNNAAGKHDMLKTHRARGIQRSGAHSFTQQQ